jgi:hypothetical protein
MLTRRVLPIQSYPTHREAVYLTVKWAKHFARGKE